MLPGCTLPQQNGGCSGQRAFDGFGLWDHLLSSHGDCCGAHAFHVISRPVGTMCDLTPLVLTGSHRMLRVYLWTTRMNPSRVFKMKRKNGNKQKGWTSLLNLRHISSKPDRNWHLFRYKMFQTTAEEADPKVPN